MPARHSRKHGLQVVKRQTRIVRAGVTVSASDKGIPVKRDPTNHRQASQTARECFRDVPKNTTKCTRFALQREWCFYQTTTEYHQGPLSDVVRRPPKYTIPKLLSYLFVIMNIILQYFTVLQGRRSFEVYCGTLMPCVRPHRLFLSAHILLGVFKSTKCYLPTHHRLTLRYSEVLFQLSCHAAVIWPI